MNTDLKRPSRAMPITKSLLLVFMATWMSLNICLGTGLIQGWGKWYSDSFTYREQTQAMLHGQLALSPSPTDIKQDYAWGVGGVQQVWGLGVPLWRLPFEAGGHLLGLTAFPDRIALAIAIAISSVIVLRAFTLPTNVGTAKDWTSHLCRNPICLAIAAILIAFPPVLTLCRGPFTVYTEAITYGYYYAIALLAATKVVAATPGRLSYFMLMGIAGVGGFIRPTILAYGIATNVVASYVAHRARLGLVTLLNAQLLFIGGIGLLLFSNYCRFGAALEFGHRLNLASTDVMYAWRFDAPFFNESLLSAARELFGAVFLVDSLNGAEVYRSGIFPLQSLTPRWRNFYHSTFDLTYLSWLVLGIMGIGIAIKRRPPSMSDAPMFVLALWSIIGLTLLTCFYLRIPTISSRYIVDFAPGIAAMWVVGIYTLFSVISPSGTSLTYRSWLVLACIALWWGWENSQAKWSFPPRPVLSNVAIAGAPQRMETPIIYPLHYEVGSEVSRSEPYPGCCGWQSEDGDTSSMAVFFVEGVKEVVLTVAPREGMKPSESDYDEIRVKVGLEMLRLKSRSILGATTVLAFEAPRRADYREGIQMLSLSFAPRQQFFEERSAFRLLRLDISGRLQQ